MNGPWIRLVTYKIVSDNQPQIIPPFWPCATLALFSSNKSQVVGTDKFKILIPPPLKLRFVKIKEKNFILFKLFIRTECIMSLLDKINGCCKS